MSTRRSIELERDGATGTGFHLYREGLDHENVYLDLRGFHFEAYSWEENSGKAAPHIIIKLPNSWAQKLHLIRQGDE
jgi:hypothetical protein